MERRDFLKLASLAGLGVAVGLPSSSREAEAAEPYTGPFWVMVNAGGGWDPTYVCDPKGAASDNDPYALNRLYLTSEIQPVGAFQVPPPNTGELAVINQFFQDHYQDLVVINGIDTQTNSHDTGSRATWTGSLTDNRPALAALIAGAYGGSLPMAFITNGGYDFTAGVVASSRVGNVDAITRAAFPNRLYPTDENNLDTFHSDLTATRIADARKARHDAMLAKQKLNRVRANMSTLYTARTGQNELKKLLEFLPDDYNQGSQLERQAKFALAAYQAGICVAANLDIGGFDTHANHDNQQLQALAELIGGVSSLKTMADQLIGGNIVIVVGSDFGRTPMYNSGNGKDHWNISSMLMMGQGITGNRLFGKTDEGHNALKVNSAGQEDPNGFTIHPGHVHKQLRKLAGIEDNPILAGSLLSEEEDLNLFT